MKPRILIDARMVGPALHGVARYVTQLAQGLHALSQPRPLPYEPLFVVGDQYPAKGEGFHGFASIHAETKFLNPREMIEFPRLLKQWSAGAYHSPSFSSLLYCPCPWIVTIHDLNHLTYGGIKERIYYELVLRRFGRKAAAVATVSEFSRRELIAWLGTTDIDIVYNAIDPAVADPAPKADVDSVLIPADLLPGKYFLCLSNPKPHKNIPLLMEAYRQYRREEAKEDREPWPLVLSMREYATEPGVRALGSLPETATKILIQNAGAMVFPSLYEGFGLPPVEAAAAGVPVIVSKIPAHHEGLVDLSPGEACWVEPRDLPGWIAGLKQAARGGLSRPSERTRAAILERFSSKRMAQHMDQIYRRVLKL